MSDERKYQNAVKRLKNAYDKLMSDNISDNKSDKIVNNITSKDAKGFKKTLDSQDIVLCHYGKFFKRENIEKISDEELKTEFQNFLKFKSDDPIGNHHCDHIGNYHWRGINRNPEIFYERDKFRTYLLDLLEKVENETKIGSDKDGSDKDKCKSSTDKHGEIVTCYNNLRAIKGMGKAKITALLLVASKGKDFGVWNTVSKEALKELNLCPNFEDAKDDGKNYILVNDVLLKLVEKYNASIKDTSVKNKPSEEIDLWKLDALLWFFGTKTQK